jgi:DNA replication and repair protein RecF
VSLTSFKASGFRSLQDINLDPHPRLNLIVGENASGKTSLLEAIYYLGRGRSFRAAGNRELIQTGERGFTLFGENLAGDTRSRSGVQVEGADREIRVDGEAGTGADLARVLPVQVIDPEIHELIQGGPDIRRRFVDWGVFHVKHHYLAAWRNYNRALKQRNASLRGQEADDRINAWNENLIEHGEAVHQARTEYLADILPVFESICSENLQLDVKSTYMQGWKEGQSLGESLTLGTNSDKSKGFTQIGPHRADLRLNVHDRRARHRVSRGQQKMLAAALVIAQTSFLAEGMPGDLVLLVDDPAAELDRTNRERLFELLQHVPAQLFITALEADNLSGFSSGSNYLITHGELASLL